VFASISQILYSQKEVLDIGQDCKKRAFVNAYFSPTTPVSFKELIFHKSTTVAT
jgi:hypothetical protein